tara:strand:- start:84 stop:512 length:429 start_codon:yes stop_codon:yes gene_type:complete
MNLMSIENKIRLNALNYDDLKIFSFLCQDAIISKEEIFYDETKNFFVVTLTRYCWEKQELNDKKINYRVVSGLQIKNVNDVEYINFKSKISFYNLLAITYEKANVILNLSMSSKIKLNCKKINATIEDIDIPWPTKLKPLHK